jgi:hypothetical protein
VKESHVAGGERRANVRFGQVRPEVDAQLKGLNACSGAWPKAISSDMAGASIERAAEESTP